MTKTKTTKRALIASVLSLLVCFSMLIGSTFAWFTDTATTGVNSIQAGKLDITLLDKGGNSLEGKTIGFVKENGDAITGDILWEPGCSYLLQPVTIKNNGDLWVKYTVVISGYTAPEGEVDLADVIDVYEGDTNIGTLASIMTSGKLVAENTLAPGASDKFTGNLKLVMQTTAGNEYQGKSISGVSVTVFATQYTKETDSYTDQYDKDANYANGVAVSSENELKGAITENKSVVLSGDIALSTGLEIPATYTGTIDLNGKTLSLNSSVAGTDALIKLSGELTIQDSATGGKITYNSSAPDTTYGYGTNTMTVNNGAKLTVINGTIENTTTSGSSNAIDVAPGATVTVNGGDIVASRIAVRLAASSTSEAPVVTFNGGSVTGYYAVQVFILTDGAKANLTIDGGTFITNDKDYGYSVCTAKANSSFSDLDEVIVDVADATTEWCYFHDGVGGNRNID